MKVSGIILKLLCARGPPETRVSRSRFLFYRIYSITRDKEIDNEIRSYYSRRGFVKIIFVVVCESPTALRLYYCP